jgi:hypothetical protein
MSSSRLSLLLAAPLTAVGLVLVGPSGATGAAELQAGEPTAFVDSDGDLLPDRLEWVLMLDRLRADSDGDGVDDFLHAVQGRRSLVEPRLSFGYDDEARVVVTTEPNPNGTASVWVNLLFRFAGANIHDLRALVPYLDLWGQRIPIDQLIGAGRTHLSLRTHPTEGLYVLCAFEFGSTDMFGALLPCTIGATVVMGAQTIRSGAFMIEAAGTTAALMPVAPDSGVIRTLSPVYDEDPFWVASRVCLLRLAVVTSMQSGMLCEVSQADCVSSGELSCPPTCSSSRGQMLFIPDGLSTVTGGGR